MAVTVTRFGEIVLSRELRKKSNHPLKPFKTVIKLAPITTINIVRTERILLSESDFRENPAMSVNFKRFAQFNMWLALG